MGRRGPLPKPRHLKLAQGTFRPDRDYGGLPRGVGELPGPPSDLDEHGRDIWAAVAGLMEEYGYASAGDWWVLQAVAVFYSRAMRADALIPEGGFYIDDKGNPRRHPAAVESAQCWREVVSLLRSCGIGVAGRARYGTGTRDAHEDGEDAWIFGKEVN